MDTARRNVRIIAVFIFVESYLSICSPWVSSGAVHVSVLRELLGLLPRNIVTFEVPIRKIVKCDIFCLARWIYIYSADIKLKIPRHLDPRVASDYRRLSLPYLPFSLSFANPFSFLIM